jgi:hexosaminidase
MKRIANVFFSLIGVMLILFPFKGNAQSKVNVFDVNNLQLSWEVIENHHQQKAQSLTRLTIKNGSKTIIPATGWYLYFNFARSIDTLNTKAAHIQHINGDLYGLKIDKPINPGDSIQVTFVSAAWVVNYTDAPGGLYIVFDQQPEKGLSVKNFVIKPSTRPQQYMRNPNDQLGLITPQMIFEKNEQIENIPADQLIKIFPTPDQYKENAGTFSLTSKTAIINDPLFQEEADQFKKELMQLLAPSRGMKGSEKSIHLKKKEMAPEAYELLINDQGIYISANDAAGIFYGLQSFKTLLNPMAWAKKQAVLDVPFIEVKDKPRFGYRGMMLDVARNFQTKTQVLKLLDAMALYKLNVLHFHLNDDEGWRLEIPSLPELTEIGSKRAHTLDSKTHLPPSVGSGPDENSFGSGYYTRNDFIEILKYARARHIRVIPEIETPGHARAAIKAMDARYDKYMKEGNQVEAKRYLLRDLNDQSAYRSVQYWNDNVINVSLPSAYNFTETIIDELFNMYKAADAPLTTIHFGGDEVPSGVWEKSPACQALIQADPALKTVNDLWYYYYDKVNNQLKSKGLYLSGWEEIAMRKTKTDGENDVIPNPDFVNENFHVNVWNNVLGWGAEDLAYKLANAGYKVVLSCVTNLYFDMAYYKDFYEPGYYWGAFVDVDKPFYFIPFDYFKNAKENAMGAPLDRSIFNGKQRLTDYGKENIVGIQAQLFGETIHGAERMEYMVFPKLLGLAERAWAKDPDWAIEKDSVKSEELYKKAWSNFTNILGKRELPRLDHYSGGYQYRIPGAGASIADQKVIINNQLPGLTLRYTTDGKEPTIKSKIYQQPIAEKGLIKIKAFSTNGRSGRVVELRNN